MLTSASPARLIGGALSSNPVDVVDECDLSESDSEESTTSDVNACETLDVSGSTATAEASIQGPFPRRNSARWIGGR